MVPEVVVAESTVEAAAGVLGGGVGAAFGLGRSPMLLVRRARPAMGVMVRRGASLARERIMVGCWGRLLKKVLVTPSISIRKRLWGGRTATGVSVSDQTLHTCGLPSSYT